jgi:hypothetical protein
VKNLIRELPAWGISLLVNLSILLPLHFIIQEVSSEEEAVEIESAIDDPQDSPFKLSNDYTFSDSIGNGGSGEMGGTPGQFTASSIGSLVRIESSDRSASRHTSAENALMPAPQPFGSPVVVPSGTSLEGNLAVNGGTEDATATGVEGTMDRIAYEVISSLRERQTLVIWMFDASQSLNDRRAQVAGRFEHVYKQLEQLGAKDGLYTAVCSYGEKPALMTPNPVSDVKDMVEAVRNITPDKSGKENVFGTLKVAIDKWKLFRHTEGRWNKLVFIITDERGDDAEMFLEPVINDAKRFQFRCFVAGNAAVFGQMQGQVQWKYEDGFTEMLPVDQGPESAFPHVIQLPFWGSGQVRLSAGYGPYALTRLCSETRGMYLVTDDTSAVKFDPARMREYKPDYRPVRVLDGEIRANPAMAALRDVANRSYFDSIPFPTLLFSAENDTQLRQAITDAQKPMADTEYWVDKLLATLEMGKQARASLKEPAWQASYDLAMGRLLAMKVRLKGYNLMLANMKSSPKAFERPGSNEWKLIASKEIDTGPKMRQISEEARSLLKQVIDEHQGTPWEQLAVKELGQDLGWTWQEGMHYVPGLENRTDVDQEQVRLLLAEENRRQQRQTMAAKQREKPKL